MDRWIVFDVEEYEYIFCATEAEVKALQQLPWRKG